MISEELQFQNTMVLTVVQAMRGVVTPNLLAVSIATDASERSLTIFFAVESTNSRFEEIVDELVLDIDALAEGAVRIETHVWQGTTWATDEWKGRNERTIFARMTESRWVDTDES